MLHLGYHCLGCLGFSFSDIWAFLSVNFEKHQNLGHLHIYRRTMFSKKQHVLTGQLQKMLRSKRIITEYTPFSFKMYNPYRGLLVGEF